MNIPLSLFPVYFIDVTGSLSMVVLSIIAFFYANKLTKLDPQSVFGSYLFWLCLAMMAFATSRGFGHIVKFLLMLTGHDELWRQIAPISGGLNTITFISITTLTFYFPNVRLINKRVKDDSQKLSKAQKELARANKDLLELNANLENIVELRTQALAFSEQKLRRFFENSQDAIFFCDEQIMLQDINEAGVAMLGYKDKNKLIGKSLQIFFSNEYQWNFFKKELAINKNNLKDIEIECIKQDQTILYLMITVDMLTDEDGNITGYEGMVKDITRFKHVMQSLIDSEKMASIGQMAASVAHEINTPLGIILGYTQLLEEDFATQQETLQQLQLIEKQTKICKKIVADLLKFSRHSSGPKFEPTDINLCIKDVLSVLEHSLNMERIYVHKDFEPNLKKTFADSEKLRQVFVNLINNAKQAIAKDGLIGIWTKNAPDGKTIQILIGDTGSGIKPEILHRIFDPFFTTKQEGVGTGLGLSVSSNIIHEHEGSITAQSPPDDKEAKRLGMETLFIITLPSLNNNYPSQLTLPFTSQNPCYCHAF